MKINLINATAKVPAETQSVTDNAVGINKNFALTNDDYMTIAGGSVEPGRVNLINEKKLSAEEIKEAVHKLNETARIFNKSIHFKVHEESKRWQVQIVDTETGEVINEIPPKKVLDMIAKLSQLVGLLVDEKR